MKTRAALCCLATAMFIFCAAAPAQAQCDDATRAEFAADVASGFTDAQLESKYSACRGASAVGTCKSTSLDLAELSDAYDNVTDAVKSIINYNVSYEQLNGCGYHPQAELVACDVEIKRTTGYGGFPGGTFEHVLFCFDCDRNGTWEFNTRGFVHVTDNVAAGPTPSWYHLAYSTTFHAPAGCTANNGGQGNVRAILSWAAAPATCTSVPFWGNIVNFTNRRDP